MNKGGKLLVALTLKVIVSLFGLFLMIFFIGEGMSDIFHGRGDGLIPYLPALLLLFFGCVMIWFRIRTGALCMAIGGAIMSVQSRDTFVILVYGLPFIILGLALWFLGKPGIIKPNSI